MSLQKFKADSLLAKLETVPEVKEEKKEDKKEEKEVKEKVINKKSKK